MPVQLLSEILEEERRRARSGKLKVFFGSAAGVGKTHAMLEAARAAKARGVDVVVGWINPRNRPELTRLAHGLESVPARKIQTGEASRAELDVAAVLVRRPALVLVDELSRTNLAPAKNEKRWQDVLELLDAGIDVHTTMNVQNVESLKRVVGQVTGFIDRDTVPDSFLERADEIELVDVAPEELLRRLSEGKLYKSERARSAYADFFHKGNLLALRELALRWAAEHVDNQVRSYRTAHGIASTWSVRERIAVCIGPAPQSASLIRAAHRMARRLKVEWHAVFVGSPRFANVPEAERARVSEHLALASRLGAKVTRLEGENAADEILRFARGENVTEIVVGKPLHARWMDRIFGSLVDDLIRKSGEINIFVIQAETSPHADSGERAEASAPRRVSGERRRPSMGFRRRSAWRPR